MSITVASQLLRHRLVPTLVSLVLFGCGTVDPVAVAKPGEGLTAELQDPGSAASGGVPQEFATEMARVQQITTPGPRHELLSRFVGEWETTTSFVFGGQKQPAGPGGVSTAEWCLDGRFVRAHTVESYVVAGAPEAIRVESELLLGHDNFKQSYTATLLSSSETAMRHAEGDYDPATDQLICYGTLDEYLTGEHDKMVRYVWRFDGDDRIVLEIHDLAIGAENTQVLEIEYRRKVD